MMKTITTTGLCFAALLAFNTPGYAIPTLQVGAGNCPTGPFGSYSSSSSAPSENDTFITSGSTLCVTGEYKDSKNPLKLGGQFDSGDNYSDLLSPATNDFDGVDGAILIATIAEAELATAIANLSIAGATLITSSADESYFPNNHAPTNQASSAYLFFDIGNFYDLGLDGSGTPPSDTIVNHTDTSDTSTGVNIELTLTDTTGLSWIHFDVMALWTTCSGRGSDKCALDDAQMISSKTILENNPGSHDTTWKDDGRPPAEIPEPGILVLLGIGLAGAGLFHRRRLNI